MTYKLILSLLVLSLLTMGCKKYLDKKPDRQLVEPNTLQDLQALLDNQGIMNSIQSASIGEASADNYYLTSSDWAALTSEGERNMYTWGDEIIYSAFRNGWSALYDRIYYSNLVLERLEKTEPSTKELDQWKNIKGSAYFFRGKSFLMAAVLWAKAYDSSTATSIPGIPLRLSTDFNIPSSRGTLQETYNQIISDLKAAMVYLPPLPKHVMRPSRAAAYALLSRTYLAIGDYNKSLYYADSSLAINNSLLDYNTLNASSGFPVPLFNPEVLFHSSTALGILSNAIAKIDSALYLSYASNDLRKQVYFKSNGNGTFGFKGSYTASTTQFIGISTSEVYLTKAECFARLGQTGEAIKTLNALLVKRWKTGTFTPLNINDAATALKKILEERRKELLMRDLRWMDLKRLNREPEHQVVVKRVLNNQVYELRPGDNRYALPIPEEVINRSGMKQNPR